jgi:spore coat polysaccharide biosynthesis predicted glycosyltransferase SpsG/RimJ/RimL family protein N-acetyltransferase
LSQPSFTLVFRCDGDLRVGAGHVARSIQLARAFEAAGVSPVFCGHYEGVAADLLARAGLETAPATGGGPLGIAVGADAAIVDSYEIAADAVEEAARALRVAAITDGAVAPAVTAVLAYHLDAERRLDRERAGVALLGPDYAPVAPELTAARRPRGFGTALVTAGGSDAGLAMSGRAARALLELGLKVHVAAPGEPMIQNARLTWELVPGGLAEQIAWADVAVSAAGLTPYDLAAAGVPMALRAIAPNQEPIEAAFIAAGLAVAEPGELAGALTRAELSAAGPRLIDGYGVFRTRDALLAAFAGRQAPRVVRYRPATRADAGVLLAWRNEPRVHEMSRSSEPVGIEGHEDWLDSVLADPDRTLLIAEHAGIPVATARFDRDGRRAEISITVDPDARGRGLGGQVVAEATELQLAARPGLEAVVAEVQRRNLPSLRAFERAGYAPIAEEPGPGGVLLICPKKRRPLRPTSHPAGA